MKAFRFLSLRLLTLSFLVACLSATVLPTAEGAIRLEPVLSGLSRPVYVTNADDGTNRLFVVEQAGKIKVLAPGATTPTVFLDITARVLSGGERGLLGLAFHPQFTTNKRFFVNYTKTDGSIVIAEYEVSADPNVAATTETVLLTIPHSTNANHNGGMIEFGPDGYLYIGVGDGGGSNDVPNNAQNINVLLGKILRIDVDVPNGLIPYSSPPTNPFFGEIPGADEIFAVGMRNPFRFSFDRGGTNQLYVGDVGQSTWEEVDIVTVGANYGWRITEGDHCNPIADPCTPPANYVPPIAEYGHAGSNRCSITGGYVYRGPAAVLPAGTYLFGDYCTGEIFSLAGGVSSVLIDTGAAINISSFGEDEAGEIYVAGIVGGTVHRIASTATTTTTTTLTSSPNPATVGASVTFTATVDGANPTGNVNFTEGGISLSGCSAIALTGNGNSRTAACSISSLGVGTHSIVAGYAGDAGNAASTSAPFSQTITAAQSSTNVALAANGGVASSSSNFSSGTTPPGAIDGDRKGLNWNNGGGWKSAAGMPQWLQVQFAGARTIDRVILYDVQDNYTNPVEPTDTMTNPLYGSSFIDFTVSMWNGASFIVVANVTNNDLVKRTVTFPAVTTDRIRVTVTRSADAYARLAEVEAFTVAQGGPVQTTTSVTSSGTPASAGTSVTFTATVTGSNPTGNVNFTEGGISLSGCSAIALTGSGNSRTAACSISSLSVGTHSIVAGYAGDAGNAASTSAPFSQTITAAPPGPTTTTLASSGTPASAGTSVTFTATVTGSNPTGNVNFSEGGVSLSGCSAIALTGSGNSRTAACGISSLSVGTHSIVAGYAGDVGNAASTSAPFSQTITAAQSSTNVALAANGGVASSSSNFSSGTTPPGAIDGDRKGLNWNNGGGWKSAAGMPQWLQVQFAGARTIDRVILYDVQDNYTNPVEPTDTMTNPLYGSSFIDFTVSMWNGASFIVVANVTNNDLVKRTVTFPAVTTDRIRVTVTRSADAYARLAEVEAFTVAQGGPIQTTTSVTSSGTPASAGTSVTFTATVTGSNPTGNVNFTEGGISLSGCSAIALTGSGNSRTAACSISSLSVGTHSIVAGYAGDAGNAASTSAPFSQTITAAPPGPTTTTLASSGTPASAGTSVTFTATVTGSNPTGNVNFTEGGISLSGCSAIALTGNGNSRTAACSISSLSVGTHSIVAGYAGDAGNAASTSAPFSQTITAAQSSTNVALAANGGVASSSSNFSSGTTPPGAIDGDRKGLNWNNGGGWKSAAGMPQWLQVQFAGARTIDRVILYDVQDNYTNPVEPTDTMTNPLYGSSFIDFTVSMWNGASFIVVANVTNNDLVKRTVTFPAVTTDRIRVTVTRSADAYARLAEIEVWTVSGGTAPGTAAWSTFGRDAQHTGLSLTASQPLNQIHWQTPVDLQPQYSGNGALLVHYGSPVISAANTVIVPVKTGATGGFRVEARAGSNGQLKWSMNTDYILPSASWTPPYGPALTAQSRLYFPGAGGTIYFRDQADDATGTSGQIAFYGLANYQANPQVYNANVIINTPLTTDPSGNIYFGFQVLGTNPAGLTSGIARISAGGQGTWTPVTTASADPNMTKVPHNSAPALSADHQVLYVAVSNGAATGYLLALDSTTLATLTRARLIDPKSGLDGLLSDNGTASPTVGTDGDVYFGVRENPFGSNHARGWLLHFNGGLSQSKTPGAFGWDMTASLVPATMVPSYQGTSAYLLMSKYNHYLGLGGDGQNKIAILDPNATQADSVTGSTVMKEVLTILGPTPESGGGVKEWCINTAAVDPFTKSILANNEDGKLYRWDLTTNTLSQTVVLTAGLGEAYTSTVIGVDGQAYATNNATLFAVGQ